MNVVCSLAPFIIAAFVRSAQSINGNDITISDLLARGQVYLLAFSLFGTIVWLAFVRNDQPRHNARIFIGILALFLMLPIFGFIGVDPTFSTIFNPYITKLSFVFYGIFILFHYLLLFYCGIEPPEPRDVFSRDASTMADKYRALGHDA